LPRPLRLGPIHRRVGVAHQVEHAVAVAGEQADADGGGQEQFMVAETERLLECAEDFAGQHRDLVFAAHRFHQADEFVATQAGQHVDQAHMLGQPRRNGNQQFVANPVAKRVIDLLELVKVDEQHRQPLAMPAVFAQALLQPFDEAAAVGQPGQRIVVGQIIEFALRLPTLGNLALELAVGPFQFVGARRDLDFQRIARRLDAAFLVFEDALRPAHDQELHQIEQRKDHHHASRDPPQATVQLGDERRDVLVELKNALDRLVLADDRNVAGEHFDVGQRAGEGVETILMGQFAGHRTAHGGTKARAVQPALADLRRIGRKCRVAKAVVDPDLNHRRVAQQFKDTGLQAGGTFGLAKVLVVAADGVAHQSFERRAQGVLEDLGHRHIAAFGQILHLL
jgi:hypothetical protein